MYISKEELKNRLEKTEVQIKEKERKERGSEKRLTHEDRVLIGVLEGEDTQKNIAELLGVSPQTVSNAARGIVSTQLGVDRDLRNEVVDIKEKINGDKEAHNKKIEEQLISNLASALGHVANSIHSTKAVDASKIAVDMSKILDRVGGGRDSGKGNRTAIIINVPSMKEEKAYQTIEV
jgi:transcriptional regulator with XRE-family HTH domain